MVYHFFNGTPQLVARVVAPVVAGQQLCISYTDVGAPRQQRAADLSTKYLFTCACPRCSSEEEVEGSKGRPESQARSGTGGVLRDVWCQLGSADSYLTRTSVAVPAGDKALAAEAANAEQQLADLLSDASRMLLMPFQAHHDEEGRGVQEQGQGQIASGQTGAELCRGEMAMGGHGGHAQRGAQTSGSGSGSSAAACYQHLAHGVRQLVPAVVAPTHHSYLQALTLMASAARATARLCGDSAGALDAWRNALAASLTCAHITELLFRLGAWRGASLNTHMHTCHMCIYVHACADELMRCC